MKALSLLLGLLLTAVGLQAATNTPTWTLTTTPTPTRTITKTITLTNTPQRTSSFTNTKTPTVTKTNTRTSTLTPSPTPSVTATNTSIWTRTVTRTNTAVPGATATQTPGLEFVFNIDVPRAYKRNQDDTLVAGVTLFDSNGVPVPFANSTAIAGGSTASNQQTQIALLATIAVTYTTVPTATPVPTGTAVTQLQTMVAQLNSQATQIAGISTSALQNTMLTPIVAQATAIATMSAAQTNGNQITQVKDAFGNAFLSPTAGAIGSSATIFDVTNMSMATGPLTAALATSVTASIANQAVELWIGDKGTIAFSSGNDWGSATATIQGNFSDTGNNWINDAQTLSIATGSSSGTITGNQAVRTLQNPGYRRIRLYCSTFSSGTNTVFITAYKSSIPNTIRIASGAGTGITSRSSGSTSLADGAAQLNVAGQMMASSGSATLPVSMAKGTSTTTGILPIAALSESPRDAYMVGVSNVAAAASATGILIFTGSATKTVMIKKITVSGSATAAGSYLLALAKYSTAASGGTSASQTFVPVDSNLGASSGTLAVYSANPTLGSIVGQIISAKILGFGAAPAAGAAFSVPTVLYEAGPNQAPIILRGTAQQLVVHGLGNSVPSGGVMNFDAYVEEF